ncbi:hypothetical protein CDAR_84111 [Caerostris darwini]|uniref:Uncharacterized protein n=1 Tax=Caerostris darwini TaxID=1538125 RepID=A0AAV4U682_9ARAC|nr:hypothetical protein CDAR_84111 [Caerostris darwini]
MTQEYATTLAAIIQYHPNKFVRSSSSSIRNPAIQHVQNPVEDIAHVSEQDSMLSGHTSSKSGLFSSDCRIWGYQNTHLS